MHEVLSYAREQAVTGKGSMLIEAKTFRMGAHTTSDDPSKYRTREEEEAWALKDPLKRLKGYIAANKLFDLSQEDELVADYKKKIDKEFEAAEKHPEYPLNDVFAYMYQDLPDELKRQQHAYENYQQNKRGGK
jgi:pyruvate dehydrogenase E1 component alpha subunit